MSVWEWFTTYEQPNTAISLAQLAMYVGIAALSGVGGWIVRGSRPCPRHHHDWTRWKLIEVEVSYLSRGRVLTRQGTNQKRECTTCGLVETRNF